jgi:hypothetical protein
MGLIASIRMEEENARAAPSKTKPGRPGRL